MDQDDADHGDPANNLAKSNRVSIRAVLVPKGQDATSALLKNGILNPVAVPFLHADAFSGSASALGDGRTPNIVATLEPDQDDPLPTFSQPTSQQPEDHEQEDEPPPPKTTTLPAAHGIKPLAPVWKRPR